MSTWFGNKQRKEGIKVFVLNYQSFKKTQKKKKKKKKTPSKTKEWSPPPPSRTIIQIGNMRLQILLGPLGYEVNSEGVNVHNSIDYRWVNVPP